MKKVGLLILICSLMILGCDKVILLKTEKSPQEKKYDLDFVKATNKCAFMIGVCVAKAGKELTDEDLAFIDRTMDEAIFQ